MLENGSDLHKTSVRRYDTIALGLLKKSHGTYVNGAIIAMLYTHLIRIINNNNESTEVQTLGVIRIQL